MLFYEWLIRLPWCHIVFRQVCRSGLVVRIVSCVVRVLVPAVPRTHPDLPVVLPVLSEVSRIPRIPGVRVLVGVRDVRVLPGLPPGQRAGGDPDTGHRARQLARGGGAEVGAGRGQGGHGGQPPVLQLPDVGLQHLQGVGGVGGTLAGVPGQVDTIYYRNVLKDLTSYVTLPRAEADCPHAVLLVAASSGHLAHSLPPPRPGTRHLGCLLCPGLLGAAPRQPLLAVLAGLLVAGAAAVLPPAGARAGAEADVQIVRSLVPAAAGRGGGRGGGGCWGGAGGRLDDRLCGARGLALQRQYLAGLLLSGGSLRRILLFIIMSHSLLPHQTLPLQGQVCFVVDGNLGRVSLNHPHRGICFLASIATN